MGASPIARIAEDELAAARASGDTIRRALAAEVDRLRERQAKVIALAVDLSSRPCEPLAHALVKNDCGECPPCRAREIVGGCE